MGHLRRAAATLVVLATTLTVGAAPATADCSGPTISYEPGEVQRGQLVEVVGTGWGDNCYDTGPPPAGEGILGHPVDHIEVVVTQAGADEIVAVGSADADYRFVVEVPMPDWLEPGDAWVSARGPWGEAFDQTGQPFVVVDGEPVSAPEVPVEFGPADGEDAGAEPPSEQGEPEPGRADESSGREGPSLAVVVAAAMACVAVGVVVLLRPRTSVTSTSDPSDADGQVRGR